MSDLFWSGVVLIGIILMHLIEEILTDFRAKFPLGEMPWPIFIGINLLLYGFAGLMLILLGRNIEAGKTMAWLLSTAMLVNGLGHLGYMVWKGAYFPGGITAPLVSAAALNLLIRLI